jgi:hypothetical protein
MAAARKEYQFKASSGFSFQQIRAWPLLSADRAAEFFDYKSSFQRFRECPAGCASPFASQSDVVSLQASDVSGNFNRDAFPGEGWHKIAFSWPAIAVEAHQRLNVRESVQYFGADTFSSQAFLHPRLIHVPRYPQPISAIGMQCAGCLLAVEIDPVTVGDNA